MNMEIIESNVKQYENKARELYITKRIESPELVNNFKPFQSQSLLAIADIYNVRRGSDYSFRQIINFFIAIYLKEYNTIPLSLESFESFVYKQVMQKVQQRTIFTTHRETAGDKIANNILLDNIYKEDLLSFDKVIERIKKAA